MPPPAIQRLTVKKRARFLEVLRGTGNVVQAAKRVRCSRQALYTHRIADATFAAEWEAALQEAMDTVLEPEAIRRAVTGVDKPVYQGGAKVGTVREYSDTLLIFLLKGGKPAKYRERHELTGKDGESLGATLGLAALLDAARVTSNGHHSSPPVLTEAE
jgi:hypothetical protein